MFLPDATVRVGLGLCFAGILACLLTGLSGALPSKTETLWNVSAVPSMNRIAPREMLPAHSSITLRGARAEYVSFQIVLTAGSRKIIGASLEPSDLRDERGHTIPRQSLRLFRERYIQVTQSTPDAGWGNRPLGNGWYPDALIPLETRGKVPGKRAQFDVAAASNQPIWVDIHIPRQTPPGNYRGTVNVVADERRVPISLSLRVWNFELPLKPSLLSSFGMHEPALTDRRVHELLLEHLVMPESVNPQDATELATQFGLNTTGLRFWSHFEKKDCSMDPAPRPEQIAAALQLYPATLPLHLYSADEIDSCPQVFDTVREWAATMHNVDSRIQNLVTVRPGPQLSSDGTGTGRSAVDIWALLPKMWEQDPEAVTKAQAAGQQIWAYTALNQDTYSPKWEIDFAPVNYRVLPGFLAQSLSVTGILYWRVDLWTRTPFEDLRGYSIDGRFYPGEGMLIYPGTLVGSDFVIPSMRLKWIRQGVQDYEYVAILKHLGRDAWAMKRSLRVATNWHEWTHDPLLLEEVRDKLGDEIDRLYSAAPAGAAQQAHANEL